MERKEEINDRIDHLNSSIELIRKRSTKMSQEISDLRMKLAEIGFLKNWFLS